MRAWRELFRRDSMLASAGAAFAVGMVALVLLAAVDDRTVLGVNVWFKPVKFASSIAIYLWTLAWLIAELPGRFRGKGLVRYGSVAAMIVEIACIAGQSARGVGSHFNDATPLDSAVFAVMGATILFNTGLELVLLWQFFAQPLSLAPAYLWGIRLGLASAVASAATGMLMVVHGGHSVGAPDGGPGLWLLNWSTRHGDLRVAHAISLHVLQLLPAVGYLASRGLSERRSLAVVLAASALSAALFAALLIEALRGHPLLARRDGPSFGERGALLQTIEPRRSAN